MFSIYRNIFRQVSLHNDFFMEVEEDDLSLELQVRPGIVFLQISIVGHGTCVAFSANGESETSGECHPALQTMTSRLLQAILKRI